jgi:hypothetical protein
MLSLESLIIVSNTNETAPNARAYLRAQNRLDFRRIARVGVVVGCLSQGRPGSPRDVRGLGSCERQFRRREPKELCQGIDTLTS